MMMTEIRQRGFDDSIHQHCLVKSSIPGNAVLTLRPSDRHDAVYRETLTSPGLLPFLALRWFSG